MTVLTFNTPLEMRLEAMRDMPLATCSFNTPLEMRRGAGSEYLWRGVHVFQYSIGDATSSTGATLGDCTALSILHWRCRADLSRRDVHGIQHFQYSIGDATVQRRTGEVAENDKRLSILHWRCRDSTLPRRAGLSGLLSILHWRCLQVQADASPMQADSFQYSIGDAAPCLKT